MLYYEIVKYGTDNSEGIPSEWIKTMTELGDYESIPAAVNGGIVMSDIEYRTHKDTYQSEYDAWYTDTIQFIKNKEAKYIEINKRTEELIKNGFAYDDKQFSLSGESQDNLLGLSIIKSNPDIYPINAPAIEKGVYTIISSEAEWDAYFGAALITKKSHIDAETVLLGSVKDAIDQAELDSIVDTR